MSIEKRNGKWMARWRDPDGRQRAKSFTTRQAAKDHLTNVQSDKLRGVYSARRGAPPLTAVADHWLDASPHLSPVTARTYRRDLDAYILPTFGKIRADKIDARTIQKWISTELKRLKPITVHRHFRTLRTLMGFARRMGYIAVNPCDDVNPPKVGRTDVRILTVDQVNAIADAIGARYRALVLVAAWAGLRWGEVVGLRRMDIDGPKVTVAGQLQNIDGDWVRLEPKWASRRTVVLPASIAASGIGPPLYGFLFDAGMEPWHVWAVTLGSFALAGIAVLSARPPKWDDRHGAAASDAPRVEVRSAEPA